jgi:hypothetical protein
MAGAALVPIGKEVVKTTGTVRAPNAIAIDV